MTAPDPAPTDARRAEDRSARIAVTVFPLLVLAAALVGFLAPTAAKTLLPQVNLFLGIIMFGMGLTLTLPDFGLVARRPLPVLLGVVAQYAIMPLLGLGVAVVLQLPPELAAGVILVGSTPGGTSSNVVSYLARADTALSVAMTSVSTLLAPLLTPLLTLWLAGQYMAVDGGAMAKSIVNIVLLPVLGGLVVRLLLRRVVDRVLPALPWVSVVFIALVVAAVVGVVLLALLGTMAAIAVPAYKQYVLRSQVAEALAELGPRKVRIVEFVDETGRCPVNDDAGFGPAGRLAGRRIGSVRVGRFDNGHCGLEARLDLPGKALHDAALWLDYDAASGRWECSSDADDRYLPASCRG